MSLPLGAHLVAGGVRFAVRARDAQGLELCLFRGSSEERLEMRRDGEIFAATVAGIGPGQRYNFRAHGDWDPQAGLFFDAAKLLVDPYAKLLDGRFSYDPRLGQRGEDTALLVPKAVVADSPATKPLLPPLFKPGGLIYELNVRGFSRNHPGVPPALRGTIAALAQPAVIAHLQKLRVNAVELMPIVAWIDEPHLPPLKLHNVWGYNPVVPMALDPGLARRNCRIGRDRGRAARRRHRRDPGSGASITRAKAISRVPSSACAGWTIAVMRGQRTAR